jgi:hypothetical protein
MRGRRDRRPAAVELEDSGNIHFEGGGFVGDRPAVRAKRTTGLVFRDVAFVDRLAQGEGRAWLETLGAVASVVGVILAFLFGFHVL